MNIRKVTAGVMLATFALLPGLLLAAPATAQAQKAKEKRAEQKGQPMRFDELPQPVQQTIIQNSVGGTVGQITLETQRGKPFYVAEITGPEKGKKHYVHVNEDGTLMK
jgi:hypothetical protein